MADTQKNIPIYLRKREWLLAVMIFLIGLVLGGCSSKHSFVEEGMDAVEALDYETALQHFEKALLEKEDLRLVYRGMGLAYMGLIQYEAAAECLEKALASGNGRPDRMDYDINYYLATVYYKLGQYEKSIQTYDAIIALKPKEKLAYYLRGSVWIYSDFEKAKADFDKAVSLGKEDYNQLIEIYQVLQTHGYKEAGVEYLQTALAGQAKSLTDYQRGRISYYLEDYENARAYLEKARNAGDYETILLLGQTCEALGDYNYAINVYTTFIENDQSNPQVYNRLGLCRMEQGDYQSALSAFQTGIAIENNDLMQTLKFNEIVTYERLGEFQKAAGLMESYLQMYPDDETAQREYVFLKTR